MSHRGAALLLPHLVALACAPDPSGTATLATAPPSSSTGTSAEATASATTSEPETAGDADSTGAAPAGEELLVASFVGDDVRVFDAATGALLAAWSPEGLDGALGLAIGPDGHVLVASEESGAVLRLDGASGALLEILAADDPGTPEDESGGLDGPGALLIAPSGELLVSSFDSDAILSYELATGAYLGVMVAAGAGGLDGPDTGMVFGPGGDLFVPSYYGDAVLRYDGVTGEFIGAFTPADGALDGPRTLLFDGDHLLVTSERSGEVVRFRADTGDFVDVLTGGIPEPAGMVLSAGGDLLVVSLGLGTVEAFDPATGAHRGTRVGPSGGLSGPTHAILRPAVLAREPPGV
jgi:streptogramin lyase